MVRAVLTVGRSQVSANEYPALRDLYDKIVAAEAEAIVLVPTEAPAPSAEADAEGGGVGRGPAVRRAASALVLAVLAAGGACAQDAVTPDVLAFAGSAPAVVRQYDTEYEVSGPGQATTRVTLVVTALAPAGREVAGEMQVVHGGFRRLRRLEGVLRDASGAVVRTLGRDDVEDQALGSLYDDLRVRRATLYGDRTPFTVEWTYEVEERGVLGWPTWRPQLEGRPTQAARFTLVTPTPTTVRHAAGRARQDRRPCPGRGRRPSARPRTA